MKERVKLCHLHKLEYLQIYFQAIIYVSFTLLICKSYICTVASTSAKRIKQFYVIKKKKNRIQVAEKTQCILLTRPMKNFFLYHVGFSFRSMIYQLYHSGQPKYEQAYDRCNDIERN